MLVLLILATVAAVKADSWGPAYSLGPTKAAVIEAQTTFNPGMPPTNAQEYILLAFFGVVSVTSFFSALFLWPGISNATSGLIQSGADQLQNQQA